MRRTGYPGGGVHPATRRLLRRLRLQTHARRHQPWRQPGLPEPERDRDHRRHAGGYLGHGASDRGAGGRRPRNAGDYRPADPARGEAAGAARPAPHRGLAQPATRRRSSAGSCAGDAADPGRHDPCARDLSCPGGGGGGDGRSPGADARDQRLGMALAAGQLHGARCRGGQPVLPRPARPFKPADPGRLRRGTGPALGRPRHARRPAAGLRRAGQRHRGRWGAGRA